MSICSPTIRDPDARGLLSGFKLRIAAERIVSGFKRAGFAVAAMGDSLNDLSLLRSCDFPVPPGQGVARPVSGRLGRAAPRRRCPSWKPLAEAGRERHRRLSRRGTAPTIGTASTRLQRCLQRFTSSKAGKFTPSSSPSSSPLRSPRPLEQRVVPRDRRAADPARRRRHVAQAAARRDRYYPRARRSCARDVVLGIADHAQRSGETPYRCRARATDPRQRVAILASSPNAPDSKRSTSPKRAT